MWRGQLTFEPPMLFSIGFLITFLFGGLTGVILASSPLDFHVTDTYFVVARYVVFGTVVFAMFAGFYFWWPKMTSPSAAMHRASPSMTPGDTAIPWNGPPPALRLAITAPRSHTFAPNGPHSSSTTPTPGLEAHHTDPRTSHADNEPEQA